MRRAEVPRFRGMSETRGSERTSLTAQSALYVGRVLDNIGVIEVTVLLGLLLLLRQVVLVVRRGWTSPQ